MQDQEHGADTPPVTPEDRIASQARTWRRFDKIAIADKDPRAQRQEYRARQHLRRVIDDAESCNG